MINHKRKQKVWSTYDV